MINPFLTSSNSNNAFTSNLISNNKTTDFFKTNNNYNQSSTNGYNPFKLNNNNSTNSSNNNDIFSRIKTNISDNSSNNNIFLNNNNNPFRTGNTSNTNMFSYNNSTFNNGSNISFQNQNMQNMKEYNFGYGQVTKIPICQTVGKNPITTFDHDIKYIRDYPDKNKINSIDYNNSRNEYISNDENLKNFSVEEIRMNDYINAKMQYFDKWSNNNYNPDNNQTNYNFTSNILNTNNNFNSNNNSNTFSIFNQNNRSAITSNGNNNTNPFLNTNTNNNNMFNTNNSSSSYNPFTNNNTNNNKFNAFNTSSNNNIFNNNNNLNNNPFNTTSKNIFNTNTNSNNIFNNNSNNSPFNINNNFLNNNNNNNNIFNRSNNIFNTNTNNNIFNNNNNNIFNNNNQNPFNSILNNNNNFNSNNNIFNNNASINNNNFVSNIFNNNRNNFLEKPFEEKIKDPTWVKRNVRIMPNDYYENWISDYMDNISKINLQIKEMQYFSDKDETKFNQNEDLEDKDNLVFNKIILSSDEEIRKYNMEKEKSERNMEKNTPYMTEDEKNIDNTYENLYKEDKRWDPIYLQNDANRNMDNIYTFNNEKTKNKYQTNKGKISGFAEASKILSNLDDDYVDFNFNNKERKEFILPTEKPEFIKFNNNMISNRHSYMSPSEHYNNNLYNNSNNNIIINNDLDINNNNYYHVSNESNYQNIEINAYDNNNNSVKNENSLKNNIINNINSNKTTKINSDEINRNLMIMEENINNEEEIKNDIYQNECKLIYLGESGNIQELKIPIIIQFSSIISPNENLLNFDLITDIILKNIASIENITDKILLPKKDDIYLKINGKIYSKLTSTEIDINQVDKFIDETNNYFYIYYGFKLKQYPLILNDMNDLENKYMTNPKLEDILNPEKNYNLKKIENFEIWNKYGKIIFLEPIDLSGKIVINDIIKINNGDIDLSHNRVDKLKARVFLYYDFGDKLEGTFLENIKYMLKSDKGNFIKYENKVLEYTINC